MELPKPTPTDVEAKDTGQFATPTITGQTQGVLKEVINPEQNLAQNASGAGVDALGPAALHPVAPTVVAPAEPRKLGVYNSKLWMRMTRVNTTDRHRKAA